MPRDWAAAVAQLTDVQKLVHLAMRYTSEDAERLRVELLRARRRAYEAELTAQAARVGCPGRRGNLGSGASLSQLNAMSQQDAASIVNTYNYDLAIATANIGATTPSANRHTYAKRLKAWDAERAGWKAAQIAQYTENSARSLAQSDFYKFNQAVLGVAELTPQTAACPVCQGWIARGQVPLRVATYNAPPYHVNCPHRWITAPEKVAKDQCPLLWMGS